MNQELIEYIKKARAAGYGDIQIKENLLKAGWENSDVVGALSSLTRISATKHSRRINETGKQSSPIVDAIMGGVIGGLLSIFFVVILFALLVAATASDGYSDGWAGLALLVASPFIIIAGALSGVISSITKYNALLIFFGLIFLIFLVIFS